MQPACTLARQKTPTGNNDNVLNVGETWLYTCSMTAIAGTPHQYRHRRYHPDRPRQDSDSAQYTGLTASFTISQTGLHHRHRPLG